MNYCIMILTKENIGVNIRAINLTVWESETSLIYAFCSIGHICSFIYSCIGMVEVKRSHKIELVFSTNTKIEYSK